MRNAAERSAVPARWIPYATLTATVCIFSIGAVFVRMAQAEGVPSLAIAALRYLFAVMIIAPFVLARSRHEARRVTVRDYGLIGLAGTTFALSLFFFFVALEHTTVLIANLVTNTHPLWVALVEVVILKMVLERRIWIGLILALGGGVLFAASGLDASSGMGANPVTGVLFALGSAFLSTVYFILGRTIRSRVSTLIFLWTAMLTGLIVMLVVALASGTALTGYPTPAYLWILLVTVTGQVIGQTLLTYTLAHLPSTLVSVSMLVQVILSAVFAFLVFHEQPGPIQIVASAVILVGVGLVVTRGQPLPARFNPRYNRQ